MEDNKLIIYKNSEGNIIVEAIYKDETLWLSQKGMSKVFECSTDNISFKNHKFLKTKEDELIITKNNHMEIISKEQFERVQDIIKHSAKVNSNNEYDIFSGYLKCKECESNLTIRKSKEYTYYACSSYVRKRGCNNKNTLRKDILEKKSN